MSKLWTVCPIHGYQSYPLIFSDKTVCAVCGLIQVDNPEDALDLLLIAIIENEGVSE